MAFPSYEELLDAFGGVVTGIESETLTAVFDHWIERLEWCLRTIVITIHKLPVGSFTFFQCLSGTKLPKPEWDQPNTLTLLKQSAAESAVYVEAFRLSVYRTCIPTNCSKPYEIANESAVSFWAQRHF
jgi:hypothetical protein